MHRVDLLKSTPFRLAIIFAALFITSFLIAGVITYQLLRNDLAERLDQSIQDNYSVLAASYGDRDLTDLIDTVDSHASSSSEHDQVYLLRAKDGQKLAGNITKADVPAGWSTVDGSRLGMNGDSQYRIYSGSIDNQPLIVGTSFEESDEFQSVVRNSFIWASAMVLVIAVAGGALLALRVHRRMEAIASTMRDVGSGKLDARIPLVGIGDDIDRLSVQLNDALGRLADLVEGMRQVSTDIAHDLKTPLQRLSLLINEAMEASGNGVSEPIERAKEEATRINATFDALLRIAQIEAGARRSRFSMIDLKESLETIAEVYADVAEDNGQSLSLSVAATEKMNIVGDRELIVQLFANLVENAIRHSPQGSAIEIRGHVSDKAIIVEINDNGPGIPEAEREKVFRRLYRLDKSRTTPGTGLGLSLVKAIADVHGAKIKLRDNGPGLGVVLTFP